MNSAFSKVTAIIPALFGTLSTSPELAFSNVSEVPNEPAIYVFFENGVPVHVGRTRKLRNRLRGHVTNSHYSASFAFKRARHILNRVATYKTDGSRSSLMKDELFSSEFLRQIDVIRTMSFRYLVVTDPIAQYLLELYAALEYGTSLSEFDTH